MCGRFALRGANALLILQHERGIVARSVWPAGSDSPGEKEVCTMFPGFFSWYQRHHHGQAEACHLNQGCGQDAVRHSGCGPRSASFGGPGFRGGASRGADCDQDSGGFGVRRPLRFLAYKLELEEAQVAQLAAILDALKTERAQAAVDHRRTIAAFAEAIDAEVLDAAKVKACGDIRVQSAERLRDAVGTALGKLHAMLDPEQRRRLSYLLRTGAVSI